MPASQEEIQRIRIVALDIYGTVLALGDQENNAKPRPGLVSFFDKCDVKGIKVVTASDGSNRLVKSELENCFKKHPEPGLTLDRFNNFFRLKDWPKDFSIIIGHYDIIPRELLVIGDTHKKDIEGATRLGCLHIEVPSYDLMTPYESSTRTAFDFSKIQI